MSLFRVTFLCLAGLVFFSGLTRAQVKDSLQPEGQPATAQNAKAQAPQQEASPAKESASPKESAPPKDAAPPKPNTPPTFRIARVSTPPNLEDYLEGKARDQETRITGFLQRDPRDGTPVSQETTAYLSYDDKNLYAIFVCKDDPKQIRAHLSKREAVFNDDLIGIVLDTFNDKRRGYIFGTNPLGIQLDGIVSEGQDDDYSFDTLWYSHGRLTDDGYVVWMAIPFKSLRFDNADVQTWGGGFVAIFRAITKAPSGHTSQGASKALPSSSPAEDFARAQYANHPLRIFCPRPLSRHPGSAHQNRQ